MGKSLLVVLLCMPMSVFALGVVNGTVTKVRVNQTGVGLAHFSADIGGSTPSCNVVTAYKNALAFDSNTAGGRSLMSVLLTAKATGLPVTAYGASTCNVYGSNVEDLAQVTILE